MMTVPLDHETLCRALDQGATVDFRFFWGHRASRTGELSDSCFSQWWPCQFTVAGQKYASAEQFMMAGKARLFGDDSMLEQILASEDPKKAKALGRKVQGFNEARWAAVRFELVTLGNFAKFGQDQTLKAYLLGTGSDILVEASPVDTIWGIGLARDDVRAKNPRRWRGKNLLGFALTRVRAILRGELPEPDLGDLPL
jgi:ribA/ribD-fused uncharacterized protein